METTSSDEPDEPHSGEPDDESHSDSVRFILVRLCGRGGGIDN